MTATGISMGDEPVRWRAATRVAFRFVCCYLILYCAYTLNDLFGFLQFMVTSKFADSVLDPALHKVVPWVGKHILNLPQDITIFSNGSGDTTYDWVLVFCMLAVALAATVVWSVLDRRRPNYRTLHAWFRQGVRLVLAAEMLLYGTDKVPPRQFGDMTLSRLVIPFGSLTPFRLLWGFMAASKPYTIFGGMSEIVGGILLLIPRTLSVGALVSAAVMANVFALNLFYDVPVKLFSFHLLMMCVFLAAPDLPRIHRLLVLNRTTEAAPVVALSDRKWIDQAVPIVVGILGGLLLCGFCLWSWTGYAKSEAQLAAKPPYYGIWVVDEFNTAGEVFTGKIRSEMGIQQADERWKGLIFERPKAMVIQCANDTFNHVKIALDSKTNRLSMSDDSDPKWKGELSLESPGPQLLAIHGVVNGNQVTGKLHRIDEAKLQLTNRGFHLINERPF